MMPFGGECRECGKRVLVTFPSTPQIAQTPHVRVRCSNCGATNTVTKTDELYQNGMDTDVGQSG